MKWYVVDIDKGFTVHEGTEQSCKDYCNNVYWLGYAIKDGHLNIVQGARHRDELIKFAVKWNLENQ